MTDPFDGDDSTANAAGHARPPHAGPDAVAFDIAFGQATRDPAVAAEASAFLREQTLLVRRQAGLVALQIETLRAEDPLIPAHLREGRIRRWAMRLRLALTVMTAIIGAAFAALVGLMVWNAATSHQVVVEAFDAPATLAARGITGKVVAAGLLDELSRLRDATRGTSAPMQARSAWSSDIKVTVPQTGISIGEIDRLLREMLGHDLHIGGELVQTEPGGLMLTVRGDGVPAKTFTGGAGDLAKLTIPAAEYAYGRSQPRDYALYLVDTGRDKDAVAEMPGFLSRAASDDERAQIANIWGVAYDDLNMPQQAVEKYRLALSLKPHFWAAWGNLASELPRSDSEEAGWRESQAMLQAAAAAPARDAPELRLLANPAEFVWDPPLGLAANLADAKRHGGAGVTTVGVGPAVADDYAVMHDWANANRWLGIGDGTDPHYKAEAMLVAGERSIEDGDAPRAITALEGFRASLQAAPDLQSVYVYEPCLLGLAYGLAGRFTEAAAVFAGAGPWSACVAEHGDVLAHQGDIAGAQRIWAQGLQNAPDIPVIYLHRGIFEMQRGDTAHAMADFATANAKAPHFADPLKAWGDALARRGDRTGAVQKYDAALRYAPAWTGLRQAHDAAAAGMGRESLPVSSPR